MKYPPIINIVFFSICSTRWIDISVSYCGMKGTSTYWTSLKKRSKMYQILIDYLRRRKSEHQAIGLVSRVFAKGLGDQCSIPGRVIPKTQKMVLDTFLLNTQYYKVRIKGKWGQSRERCSALGVVTVKKGAFGSTSMSIFSQHRSTAGVSQLQPLSHSLVLCAMQVFLNSKIYHQNFPSENEKIIIDNSNYL